ncbi:MAG: hypothetical protein EAZ95_08920 [Bacteroidetes bacterium]|nr:MAG: hypothetical protein EAZ95_08920 [Bacteroidota bacterium]
MRSSTDFYTYTFISEGKQTIRKTIAFTPTPIPEVYNLGFGDTDLATGKIDFTAVSNNGDTKKVLANVASAVWLFSEQYPQYGIVAMGVTPARNRLYRMGIQAYWDAIEPYFDILGYYQGNWEYFILNRNYEAFLAKRKPITI